jgi:hypothetical protein
MLLYACASILIDAQSIKPNLCSLENKMKEKSELSECFERFKSDKAICDLLPLKLSNGYVITDLDGSCPECGKVADKYLFRGVFCESTSTVVTYRAQGLCECKALFRIDGRLRAVGKTMQQEYIDNNGVWVRRGMQYVKKRHRLISRLKKVVSAEYWR